MAVAIGLPVSYGTAVPLRHLLAGISPFDPVAFGVVVVLILAASLAACWLPACRAARVDPMVALRSE